MPWPSEGAGRLGKLVSIAQVAQVAGWEYQRMRRHLVRMNEQLGGLLLSDVRSEGSSRPRYMLTMAALEQVQPNWFAQCQSLGARVEELEEELGEREDMIAAAHRDIGRLSARVEKLERRLASLEARRAA